MEVVDATQQVGTRSVEVHRLGGDGFTPVPGGGHEVDDLGTHSTEPVDYPPLCAAAARLGARLVERSPEVEIEGNVGVAVVALVAFVAASLATFFVSFLRMARPMPDAAPVTTATLPVKSSIGRSRYASAGPVTSSGCL